ncbi:MAG: MFS transporter [Herbaspirillum sp.]|nr:MFS transporter [Herbaspirillum sp.]
MKTAALSEEQAPEPQVGADFTQDENAALRKAAWRLIPLLALAYFFNYLDRTSVGFAALTMNQDLGLTAAQFGIGAGIMFAAYCLCEVPSNLAMYRFGARKWIARIMITWGLAAAATAWSVGPNSFYAFRLLLGVAEAGFFPGVIFFLTLWFPAKYRARVLAWFTVSTPLSSLIGGPVAVWLLQFDGALGLAGWQWMFIVTGLPACLLGLVVLVVLADKPAEARWLTEAQRNALQGLLEKEGAAASTRKSMKGALKDPRVYLMALISFSFTLGSYGIGIWLPQILKTHGVSLGATGWVSAIPYFFATIGLIWWAAHVDRHGRAIKHLVMACLLAALAMVFSVAFGSLVPAMVGITLALVGTISARTIFYTIPGKFLSGQAAAGGLAFINSIGALGGFAGPYLVGYLKDLTGSFAAGMIGMAVILTFAAGLSLSIRLFMKDN